MRHILSGQISPVQLMFAPPDDKGGADIGKEPGNGALEAGNFSVASTSSEDETPPDFGALAEKYGDTPDANPNPPKVEPPAPPPAVREAPAAPPAAPTHPTDPNRNADGTFKKGKSGKDDEEPFPDIEPLKPKPVPVPKPPEPIKPTPKPGEAAPAAPATPPATPAAPTAPKPGETAPPAPPTAPKADDKKPLPKDDADIDGMEPKPTASEKTRNDFKALKDIAKTARAEARRLEGELTAAAAKAAEGLTPEIKTELEDLRARVKVAEEFKSMFELENEPRARAEHATKLLTAEEKILKTLVEDPRLKLPQEKADALKAAGFDSPAAIAMRNGWFKQIREGTGDEMLVQELADLFRSREKVVQERAQHLENLRGNRDGYMRERQEKEKGEFNEWGAEADKTLVKLSEGHDWTDFMKAPENATPEQLAVIEAHNKHVKDDIVPAFNAAVLDVFHRKPAETVSIVFDAMRAKHELEPKIATLEADIAAKDARIAELETLANGVRRTTSLSQAEQAPAAPVTVAPDGISGAAEPSADAALDAFLSAKGKR